MRCVIAKVDEVFFDGEAVSMTVPGTEGEMTVLAEHMPLITTLKQGSIVVRLAAAKGSGEAKEKIFPIQSGVLEVRRDGATVIL